MKLLLKKAEMKESGQGSRKGEHINITYSVTNFIKIISNRLYTHMYKLYMLYIQQKYNDTNVLEKQHITNNNESTEFCFLCICR